MIIPQTQFRLYVLIGCSHCEQAAQFLQSTGLSFEVIVANNDPIILEGTKSQGGKFPILISHLTNEALIGFKQEDYVSVVQRSLASISARAANGAAAKLNNTNTAPEVLGESTPTSVGAA